MSVRRRGILHALSGGRTPNAPVPIQQEVRILRKCNSLGGELEKLVPKYERQIDAQAEPSSQLALDKEVRFSARIQVPRNASPYFIQKDCRHVERLRALQPVHLRLPRRLPDFGPKAFLPQVPQVRPSSQIQHFQEHLGESRSIFLPNNKLSSVRADFQRFFISLFMPISMRW